MTVSTWRPEALLTADQIEARLASVAAEAPSEVRLHLGRWSKSGPLADAYLQGALCLLHRLAVPVRVEVPPLTLTGDRPRRAFATPDPKTGESPKGTPTELLLAHSLGGLIVGQLGTFEERHARIPALQREQLAARGHEFGTGRERALAVADSRQVPGGDMPLRARAARLHYRVERLMCVLPPGQRKSLIAKRQAGLSPFDDLVTFLFEAAENTTDHARLGMAEEPLPQVRFIHARRVFVRPDGRDVARLAGIVGGPTQDYFDGVDAWLRRVPTSGRTGHVPFLEVTVGDGGVGVPALMASTLEVYEGSFSDELKRLEEALLPDRSTKPPGIPGRGQGFRKMLRATHAVQGCAILRTGRCRIVRTYLRPDGSSENLDFEDEESPAYNVEANSEPLPLIAGTVVTLLFPVVGHR